MSKGLAITLFLILLAIGAAFGIARDLYSRERSVVKGVVIEIDRGGMDNKSQTARAPSLKVRLDSGSLVDVAVTQTSGMTAGQPVHIAEMVMPWGQVWYQIKGE